MDASALDASTMDASAPDASTPRVGCGGEVECPRYVFVTSKTYSAKMKGPVGADQRCQLLADATTGELHGRTFRAWLGDQLAPASLRHPHGTRPYRLVDGTVVADDRADLTDGSLQAGIDLTEKGERATGGVWTATNPKGDGMSQDCDEWDTTGGVGGAYGTIGAKDEAWTVAGGVYGCATELALYCFEH